MLDARPPVGHPFPMDSFTFMSIYIVGPIYSQSRGCGPRKMFLFHHYNKKSWQYNYLKVDVSKKEMRRCFVYEQEKNYFSNQKHKCSQGISFFKQVQEKFSNIEILLNNF